MWTRRKQGTVIGRVVTCHPTGERLEAEKKPQIPKDEATEEFVFGADIYLDANELDQHFLHCALNIIIVIKVFVVEPHNGSLKDDRAKGSVHFTLLRAHLLDYIGSVVVLVSQKNYLVASDIAAAVARKPGELLVIEEVIVAPPKVHEVCLKLICTSGLSWMLSKKIGTRRFRVLSVYSPVKFFCRL
ncbi:hypothetical protein FXO38_36439 [Capsicum annuum]|nr:hypothetical protein FXO38_36439 [Capsicum annuum]